VANLYSPARLYRSPQQWIEVSKTNYGPMLKTIAALEPRTQAALHANLLNLVARFNTAKDGTMAVPSEYSENRVALDQPHPSRLPYSTSAIKTDPPCIRRDIDIDDA
jgi:hypothetical protein